ncbi:hypothetical protein [Saccharopolyspora erythraea]|uniref:Uncharacterized protein n=1 Tax=Saccharopolyspora erythraea TaxID=1836 RepID=A0ABN1DAC3_SACER|nr:hypothetical protein [Saccharopolyspora erythraea]EQD86328.1 hypothetical protein N599_10345 [Saccharopolyspora erythraea D]QRK89726.1 hypothetical protein JQX30_35315 [Saccharopolyspora erythraea]
MISGPFAEQGGADVFEKAQAARERATGARDVRMVRALRVAALTQAAIDVTSWSFPIAEQGLRTH